MHISAKYLENFMYNWNCVLPEIECRTRLKHNIGLTEYSYTLLLSVNMGFGVSHTSVWCPVLYIRALLHYSERIFLNLMQITVLIS
jgi:hypothetical protein